MIEWLIIIAGIVLFVFLLLFTASELMKPGGSTLPVWAKGLLLPFAALVALLYFIGTLIRR